MSINITELDSGIAGIRLESTTANVLHPGIVAELTSASAHVSAPSSAAVLIGGDTFFCNGLDFQWAVVQERSTMRHMFLSLCALVLANAVTSSKDVTSAAVAKAATLGALPRLAFAHSQHQRSLTLRREIRTNVAPMIDCLLDAWFGPEAQALLPTTAERLTR